MSPWIPFLHLSYMCAFRPPSMAMIELMGILTMSPSWNLQASGVAGTEPTASLDGAPFTRQRLACSCGVALAADMCGECGSCMDDEGDFGGLDVAVEYELPAPLFGATLLW